MRSYILGFDGTINGIVDTFVDGGDNPPFLFAKRNNFRDFIGFIVRQAKVLATTVNMYLYGTMRKEPTNALRDTTHQRFAMSLLKGHFGRGNGDRIRG